MDAGLITETPARVITASLCLRWTDSFSFYPAQLPAGCVSSCASSSRQAAALCAAPNAYGAGAARSTGSSLNPSTSPPVLSMPPCSAWGYRPGSRRAQGACRPVTSCHTLWGRCRHCSRCNACRTGRATGGSGCRPSRTRTRGGERCQQSVQMLRMPSCCPWSGRADLCTGH